ncbi:MAG: type II toxin-antitoxin system HicA family toxin [Bacteroidales bacterium]|nr:type II toxin-antitoxin system HicA family toxin [Bacteroidales bacterium]
MKYAELERRLRKCNCYYTGEQANGHPLWYSPITGRIFKMSNHSTNEVPKGTLHQIMRDAGISFMK